MLRDVKKICFVVFFILFVLSCSQSEPEISHGSLELVYYENGGNPVERFSFFVLPRDNDGIEDLEDLWLYHDWEGLSWHLTSKDWISQTIDGSTWIGSRAISMVDNGPLPRGLFRSVLVDKGGSRTERLISFDAPAQEREFPFLSIEGNRYRIVSRYPEQDLLVYDNEGSYLLTVNPPSTEGNVSDLGLPSQAESISLWARDSARSVSAFTDIVPLR
jgi:hypothetical protein